MTYMPGTKSSRISSVVYAETWTIMIVAEYTTFSDRFPAGIENNIMHILTYFFFI